MAESYLFKSQDEITAQLKGIKWGASTIKVYDGQFDDDELFKIAENQEGLAPFIVTNFSGELQSPMRMHGIVGASRDTSQTMFTVQVVHTNSRITRQVMDQINQKIKGFVPTGCGEVNVGLYASPGKINALGTPTRYSAVQSFSYYVNSNAIC